MVDGMLATYRCDDMTVLYPWDEPAGRVGLWLVPTALADRIVARRPFLDEADAPHMPGPPARAWAVEPLVQLAVAGDAAPDGFAQGRTMRNAPAARGLRYREQEVARTDEGLLVITRLEHASGYVCEHHLSHRRGDAALRAWVRVRNVSDAPLTLEMLASFSLGGITPFAADDAPGRLVVHRLRSVWSDEARLVGERVEALRLERSWSGHGVACERFGQVGTLPVRGFAPFVAVEDEGAGVVWGAQVAWAGSWQMEVYRRDDCLCVSGGLADREVGHWAKTLAPDEGFTTPEAILSVARGDVDDLCRRLVGMQSVPADAQPAVEADLPIQFNEYCTSWGKPRHDAVVALAERLAGTPVSYLVIDAGWYAGEGGDWATAHGDWIPNRRLFPEGLAATATAIRERGLIPGLWIEIETCGRDATAFGAIKHLLARDGAPLTVGDRRFWDMTDPAAVAYLSERVIDLLERCGFGYLKVDYNETIGVGCDGAESPGEGLRRQVEGTYAFFRRIRDRLPGLVIENCASGGQRLEPSLMALSSLGSFSDAHETREIPIIAANVQRLILPRQLLVWAVLRRDDDARRLVYSLAATFLGRMCLSGDVLDLDDAQWAIAQRAMRLYRAVWPLIKYGVSRRVGPDVMSYRHPRGWQAVLRASADGTRALAVLHTFGPPVPKEIAVTLPCDGLWRVADGLGARGTSLTVDDRSLRWRPDGPFDACVAYLVAG